MYISYRFITRLSGTLLLIFILFGNTYPQSLIPSWPTSEKKAWQSFPISLPLPCQGEFIISDHELIKELTKLVNELKENSHTTAYQDLLDQLDRKTCTLVLKNEDRKQLTGPELYTRGLDSVLMIVSNYKCPRCDNWHFTIASGYIISESGACVTSYHVIDPGKKQDIKHDVMIAVNGKGKKYGIKSVLAADKKADFAILQLDGNDFQALPLKGKALVGSDVYVLSHPAKHFFVMTKGIISRYLTHPHAGELMAITADYARGSSGGPVFNVYGEVVGMVRETKSIYYRRGANGSQENLQMVFKHCVPAEAILKAIEKE